MRLRVRASDPGASWYRHRVCPRAQEAVDDGRYRGLLHLCPWLHRNPGQLRQGHLCGYRQDLRLLDSGLVEGGASGPHSVPGVRELPGRQGLLRPEAVTISCGGRAFNKAKIPS